jgi:hypothetical protein
MKSMNEWDNHIWKERELTRAQKRYYAVEKGIQELKQKRSGAKTMIGQRLGPILESYPKIKRNFKYLIDGLFERPLRKPRRPILTAC